jgi:hypothetical protein
MWLWPARRDAIGARPEHAVSAAPSRATDANGPVADEVDIDELLALPRPVPRKESTPESLRGSDAFDPAVVRLLQLIRAHLPTGWKASYHKPLSWLEVSLDQPVLAYSKLPNGPPGEKPKMRDYSFAYRVGTPLSRDQYSQLHAENVKTQRAMTALYNELEKRSVDQKFDSFSARKAVDKPLVARYDALKSSLHELPDFYFADISLNTGGGYDVSPADERVNAECQRIREQVEKLLSRYDN